MTLIQAQTRYMNRIKSAHPGHLSRVKRSARKELGRYLEKAGTSQMERMRIIQDADDMLNLENNSDEA